ncbi:MBL fold metallo-hydrolase [Bacillus alkalicellulosilyticus]|uniref:MBL fold metallo-hydrolase n=1 Tax=Alkalihalobacterium alkalicellulosilyticum TaxID=1912214 RepID=UPI0009970407|nr:MBL fold metallo-hydrolase [Bacillus alkalicellulosilyticus]
MKLTVIGCWHGFPKEGQATSGYLLEQDGFRLLIDCGSGVVSHLQKYCAVEDLDAVILSHYHHDHVADIGVLQYARLFSTKLGKTNKVLPIYGHQLDEEKYKTLSYEPYVISIPYEMDTPINIGPFHFSFIKTNHPAPCAAMRINNGTHTVVYTADTAFFPELVRFASDCDVLLTECSFFAEQSSPPGGHMNTTEVGILGTQARVKSLLLCHLPHFGDLNQLKREVETYYKRDVKLATLGYNFELN